MKGWTLVIAAVAFLSSALVAQEKPDPKPDIKQEQESALLKRVQELEAKLAQAQATLKSLKATPVATIADGRAVISCTITK